MPKDILTAMAASERMELYCMANPGSPSAIQRPRLSIRSGVWVAFFGESIRNGTAGFGPTVETALAAFDCQYLNAIRARKQRVLKSTTSRFRKPGLTQRTKAKKASLQGAKLDTVVS